MHVRRHQSMKTTYSPKLQDTPRKIPLFHFNTTIVDLKPFNPENCYGQQQQQENYNINEIYGDIRGSPTNPSKKFLIKKNLNFYEPVKDAEMLAQLKTLRTKLSGNDKMRGVVKNETLKHSKSLNLPTKSKTESLIGNASTNKGTTTMGSSTYLDEDKTSAVVDDYLNSTRKPPNNTERRDDLNTPMPTQALLNVQMKPIETVKNTKECDLDKADSYSLKSYNLSSFISDKRGIKSPECNLQYYVNQGHSDNEICQCQYQCDHRNSHVINIPNIFHERSSVIDYDDVAEINKITNSLNMQKPLDKKLKLRSRAHTSFNDRQRIKAGKEIELKTSFSKVPPLLPDISPFVINSSQINRNVKNVLRKSRKSRLGNIYKVENPKLDAYEPRTSPKSDYHSDSYQHQQCSCQSIATKKSDYRTEIDTQDGIELARFNENHTRKNLSSPDLKYINTVTIQDTFSTQNKNTNLIKQKGYPYERLQRKEAPIPPVQNIISDIPSTINRMSLIGNVTNVEKLIANRLSEFYTTNRVIN